MTNYHWNGGSDIRSRALLHDSQLLKREQRFLRDAVFDFLAAKHPKLPLSYKQFLEQSKIKIVSEVVRNSESVPSSKFHKRERTE